MADKKITADQLLDEYIPKYESGYQNVPNYMYDDTHTASGPWQITNTNWRNIGPKVGIDTDKFPSAMSAERGEQRKVAEYLLNYTPQGIRNWTDFNPKLKAALSAAGYEGGDMPQQEQEIDPSTMTNEQLMKALKKEYPSMTFSAPPPQTKDKKGEEKEDLSKEGWLGQTFGRVVTAPDDPRSFQGGIIPDKNWLYGGFVWPGIKRIAKGLGGYNPEGHKLLSGASDVMEGVQREAVPIGLGLGGGEALLGGKAALTALEAGVKDPALLSKIGATLGGMGRATIPMVKTAAGAVGGGMAVGPVGGWVGDRLSDDPEAHRLGENIGDFIGAGLGSKLINSKFPSISNLSVSPAMVRAAGRIIPPSAGGHISRFITDYIADKMLERARAGGIVSEGAATEPPEAPKSIVKPPPGKTKPDLPKTIQMDEMLAAGTISQQQYNDRLKNYGLSEAEIAAKSTHAHAVAAAKNPPSQIQPNAPVNLPGNTQVKTPPMPVAPPQQQQPPILPPQQAPQFPVNMPMAGGTPFAPTSPLGDVRPPGERPQAIEEREPPELEIGQHVDSVELENNARAIATAALGLKKSEISIPKRGWTYRQQAAKALRLRFTPTIEEWERGSELFKAMLRSRRPTANNPGKKD